MSSNRLSNASNGSSKRWSMPSLQPLEGLDDIQRPPMQQTSTGSRSNRSSMVVNTLKRNSSANRLSMSGTSHGKSDFGVPLTLNTNLERRVSKRHSRISKLSDVSEADSNRTRSRALSMLTTDSDRASHRYSRKLSLTDQLAAEADQKRMSRRSSTGANSIVNGNRTSLMNRTLEWQQNPETLQKNAPWDDDLKKASNWNSQKKLLNTIMSSVLAFCYIFTISIYAAAPSDLLGKVSFSRVICALPYAAFALGFAFGPAVATPFEKAYGRKIVPFASLPVFALLMIGAAVSKSIAAMTILRFLAAVFAAPGLWLTTTVLSEVWIGTCQTMAFAFYTTCLVLGFAAGPIVGGVITHYTTWHWTGYTTLLLSIIMIFINIAVSETQEDAIKRKDKTSVEVAREIAEKDLTGQSTRAPSSRLHFRGNLMFKKPFQMLFASQALSMTTLYLSYTTSILVALPLFALPEFAKAYKFDTQSSGFTFIAVAIGVVAALAVSFIVDRYVHQPRLRRWEAEIDGMEEKGTVEVIGREGITHASWRKGVAVSKTESLGVRSASVGSNTTTESALRSNSDASSFAQISPVRRHKRRPSRIQAASERNINIAIAMTRFLNAQPENMGNKVIVERVMVLLQKTSRFTDICTALSELGLSFDEALLARAITTAIRAERKGSEVALSRSRSLHRLTAQAALMGSADSPSGTDSDEPTSPTDSTATATTLGLSDGNTPVGPPPEWRWLPALPATLLFPAGLAMFAWTLRPATSWIVPCIGLGVTGLGAALIMTSAYAYLLELHWDQDLAAEARAPATMIGFVMAAVISFVADVVVDALGLGIGVSIFAGVAAVGGVVPWIIAFGGGKARG